MEREKLIRMLRLTQKPNLLHWKASLLQLYTKAITFRVDLRTGKGRIRFAFIASGAIFIASILFHFLLNQEEDTVPLAPTVKSLVIERKTLKASIDTHGTVTYLEKAAVAPRITGRISSIHKDLGDLVKKGEILATLEDTEYRLSLQQAQGNVKSSAARTALSKTNYEDARRNSERQIIGMNKDLTGILEAKGNLISARQKLMNKKEIYSLGGISREELKTHYTNYVNAMSSYYKSKKEAQMGVIGMRDEDLESSGMKIPDDTSGKKKALIDFNTKKNKDELSVARTEYQNALVQKKAAEVTLNETRLKSPIDGFVASRAIEIGEEAKPGEAVYTVVKLDQLIVSVNLPEKDIARVELGKDATVLVDAVGEKEYAGKVYKIAPVIDVQTRTFEVRILVENKDLTLKPGMFARVSLLLDEAEKAIGVPVDAVMNLKTKNGLQVAEVFVVKNKVAYKKQVVINGKFNGEYRVTEGLDAGEEIIVDKLALIQDGTPVRPIPVSEGSETLPPVDAEKKEAEL